MNMFFNLLVGIDYNALWAIFISLALLICLIYLITVVLSFAFMLNFRKKIKKGKETINVVLFQKNDSLMKLASLLQEHLKEDNPLAIFAKNEELKKYNELKAEEFDEFYNYSEKILNCAQRIYISYDFSINDSYIKDVFLTLVELNNKYFESVQLYNTNVIGYNYWRNLFSTRWIKNILFIKEIDTIK